MPWSSRLQVTSPSPAGGTPKRGDLVSCPGQNCIQGSLINTHGGKDKGERKWEVAYVGNKEMKFLLPEPLPTSCMAQVMYGRAQNLFPNSSEVGGEREGQATSIPVMNPPDTGLMNQELGIFVSRSAVSVSAKKCCSALG